MPVNPDLVRGTLNTLLLETLADEPRYGYEICKIVEQKTGGYFRMREGSLYPALHRMEKAGLLRATWRDAPEGRRRKYYQLTARGRKELAARRKEWRDFSTAVNAILSSRRFGLGGA
ncbi:MAG: PadR family transcriptional regulator [Phycisphaerae bacterium]